MSGLAACEPHSLMEQYEALRREATAVARDSARGHGLALFLARGMRTWLETLVALAPPSAGSRPPRFDPSERGGIALEPSLRVNLTTVMAGMVLACVDTQEVSGEFPVG